MQYRCPSLRPSVGRIVSTLYLLQYMPDPFHINTSYQATSDVVLRIKVFKKIWSFGKLFKFIALTLSCFDLGFNMNWSVVWVIMGRRGVSSERRRSSCSHYGNQSRGCLMRGGPLWPPTVPRLAARSSQSNPGGLSRRCWSMSGVTWPLNLEFRRWGSSGPSSLM